MKPVLTEIFQLKRQYQQLPLFHFLRDESRSPRERLSFLPCIAPFIMSFADLNRHVLRSEPSDDVFQQMLNAHSHEDDHHWPWYLEDFSQLGHDQPAQAPSDTLRWLYSDATVQNRLLSLRLAHLIWGATPAVRLAIVEAIEETGNVLFSLTAQVAGRLQRETGLALRYCGDFHFRLESGHAMNNEHAALAAITLDEAARADALQRVRQVFAWFSDWTHELLRCADAALAPQPIPLEAAVC